MITLAESLSDSRVSHLPQKREKEFSDAVRRFVLFLTTYCIGAGHVAGIDLASDDPKCYVVINCLS